MKITEQLWSKLPEELRWGIVESKRNHGAFTSYEWGDDLSELPDTILIEVFKQYLVELNQPKGAE